MEDYGFVDVCIVTELACIYFDGIRFFTVSIHAVYIEFTLLQVFEFSFKPELDPPQLSRVKTVNVQRNNLFIYMNLFFLKTVDS